MSNNESGIVSMRASDYCGVCLDKAPHREEDSTQMSCSDAFHRKCIYSVVAKNESLLSYLSICQFEMTMADDKTHDQSYSFLDIQN